MQKFAVGTALAVMLGLPAVAQAALVSCPASMYTNPTSHVENAAGTLTAASGCQYLSPPDTNNVANIANINTAAFFGFTDWTANGTNLQIGPGGASGTWAIQNVNFTLNDYIIVFKDGDGTNLIAFSFNEAFSSGSWTTPFTAPPFTFSGASTAHDVSHFTIAQRTSGPGPGTPVPEPGTLSLLGMGLLALGMFARQRRRPA